MSCSSGSWSFYPTGNALTSLPQFQVAIASLKIKGFPSPRRVGRLPRNDWLEVWDIWIRGTFKEGFLGVAKGLCRDV